MVLGPVVAAATVVAPRACNDRRASRLCRSPCISLSDQSRRALHLVASINECPLRHRDTATLNPIGGKSTVRQEQ